MNTTTTPPVTVPVHPAQTDEGSTPYYIGSALLSLHLWAPLLILLCVALLGLSAPPWDVLLLALAVAVGVGARIVGGRMVRDSLDFVAPAHLDLSRTPMRWSSILAALRAGAALLAIWVLSLTEARDFIPILLAYAPPVIGVVLGSTLWRCWDGPRESRPHRYWRSISGFLGSVAVLAIAGSMFGVAPLPQGDRSALLMLVLVMYLISSLAGHMIHRAVSGPVGRERYLTWSGFGDTTTLIRP